MNTTDTATQTTVTDGEFVYRPNFGWVWRSFQRTAILSEQSETAAA